MAKLPASDTIMAADKLRPLLSLSKTEPVQAAFGLTAEGEAVLLLDKKAEPRKVMAMLRASAGKAKIQLNSNTLRFGRAEVDPDYDAGMVRLFVNKDAPGNIRARLVEVVKHASYQKVEINVDPSLEESGEDANDTAQAQTNDAPSAPADVPEPPPPPPKAAVDEAAQRHMLADLIGRIAAAAGEDAGRKATLLKVAGIANDQIKAGNAEAALATIAKLRQVLDASGAGAGPKLDPHRWAAARSSWQEASELVDAQITALKTVLTESDENLHEIAEYGLNAVTNNHKVPLMAALMDIGAGTPESLAKGGKKALAMVQAFKQHIETDERVAACDENPGGVAVTIRTTLGPALAQLEAALLPA